MREIQKSKANNVMCVYATQLDQVGNFSYLLQKIF